MNAALARRGRSSARVTAAMAGLGTTALGLGTVALRILVLGGLVLGTLAGCDSMPGRPRAADRPLRPAQVKDFAALWGRSCAGCHGADGRLGAGTPLNDAVYLALTSDDELRRAIADGVPGTAMPPFALSAGGELSDEQVSVLVREMRSRWADPAKVAGATLPPYSTRASLAAGLAPGDPRRGAAAYAAYCAQCHGADGAGSGRGGSVIDGSYLALASEQALRTAVIAGRPDLGMPDWRGYAKGPMSAQEIADVVAWLVAQRKPFPGQPHPGVKGAS